MEKWRVRKETWGGKIKIQMEVIVSGPIVGPNPETRPIISNLGNKQ
jgi:hypothetical protein